ncbi:hypothetical protein ABFX02_09G128036 [Erythranthe guttata]
MIWRLRFKFLANITFSPPKSRSFSALHHLASPLKLSTDSNPRFKSFSNQQQPSHNPQPIFLTHQIVLTTLQNCPSDLVALSFFLWCARQPHYFHDKPTFRHMVGVVSTLTQSYGTVKGIVHELEAVGCVTKAQTLLLLMRIYWCGTMYPMVIEAFHDMCYYGYTPNTYARNIVMDVRFKLGDANAALKILGETESPNFLSFNIAICNLCRLNDVDNIRGVLRSMLMKGYYMNLETYTLVFNCFCKFGRLEEALQLLGMLIVLGGHVSENVWGILIDGFCKSGQIEVAAYLREKMVEIGCSPNVVTCTPMIKGFMESRMPAKAFEILGALKSKGCFPDLVLCNVLIDCLSKMGWYDDAFEVFSSLRERRLMPDAYTYSSIVSTICLSGQYVLLPFLTSGFAVQPDLVVCNSLLNYYCKSGYPDFAVEFYDDMIDRGFQPDKYSYAGLLSALCKSGRRDEALNVYRGIIRICPGIDAHIHTIIINELTKSGGFDGARILLKEAAAKKYSLDAVSYNVVICGLIMGSKMNEAYTLFTQMKETNVAPDKLSYNRILSGFCKDRNFSMVKHVLPEVFDRNIEIDYHTYRLMKNLLCDSPETLSAFNHLFELRNSEQLFLVDGHDSGTDARNSSLTDYRDILHLGTASSDEFSDDAIVSVG